MESESRLKIAIVIATIFMFIEIIGGYIADSLAIYSDAAHLLSDIAGFIIALYATIVTKRKSCNFRTFGYHRAEVIGSILSILSLWFVTIYLLFCAFSRALDWFEGKNVPINGRIMFYTALFGVFVNVVLISVFHAEHMSLTHDHSHDHQEFSYEIINTDDDATNKNCDRHDIESSSSLFDIDHDHASHSISCSQSHDHTSSTDDHSHEHGHKHGNGHDHGHGHGHNQSYQNHVPSTPSHTTTGTGTGTTSATAGMSTPIAAPITATKKSFLTPATKAISSTLNPMASATQGLKAKLTVGAGGAGAGGKTPVIIPESAHKYKVMDDFADDNSPFRNSPVTGAVNTPVAYNHLSPMMTSSASANEHTSLLASSSTHNHDHDHNHAAAADSHSHSEHDHDHSLVEGQVPYSLQSESESDHATTAANSFGGHNHSHGHSHGGDSNIQAAFLHVLTDMIQSIGVALAGAVVWWKPEWQIVDPLCTLLFSLLVMMSTVSLFTSQMNILMEGVPDHLNVEKVSRKIREVAGVTDLHSLHIWSLSNRVTSLSVHIKATNAQKVYPVVYKLCKGLGFVHITIQAHDAEHGPCACAS